MTTLSATSSFPISAADTATETAEVFVLPVAGPGEGTGRLIHPTLGTWDYPYKPDRWRNFRTDIIVPPVWSSVTTLGGVANTLWSGKLGDVVVEESWNAGELAIEVADFDTLVAMWTAPPDPTLGEPDGYVQWWPSYACALGFHVIILGVTNGGGDGNEFDPVSEQGWIVGPLTIQMRIVGRVE